MVVFLCFLKRPVVPALGFGWPEMAVAYRSTALLTVSVQQSAGNRPLNTVFLRTQYSKQLLERPMEEAKSCIVLPVFFHSSTLANMVACF
jgi:hypothetical protein